MVFAKLSGVNGFDDDAIRDAFASGEAAAVLLNDMDHVVRVEVVLLLPCFLVLLPKGNDDRMLQVVQNLRVIAPDELLQLFL